jgi:hypothetical protein
MRQYEGKSADNLQFIIRDLDNFKLNLHRYRERLLLIA